MVAENFQTRIEEQIQQLLRDKKSKKVTHNAVKTLKDFCKEQNLDESNKAFKI